MKVLILGGYGTFGGRLAELLADEGRLTLIVAGRSLEKTAAFCAALEARAAKVPLAFDRDGDLERQLRSAAPNFVVDASGPFQDYGDDPYRVVKACIALGIDYLDLADGARFVNEIGEFDEAARARNVFVLAGASSFPVLTAAVVRRLARGLEHVDTVRAGIAPSPFARIGANVIRAIASYAGKPIALRREGRSATAHALIDATRFTIRPPGRLPIWSRRFTLVETPDLQALPALWPGLKEVWVGVGTVPAILHRGLAALAWLVRLRLLRSLARLAPLFHAANSWLRWGEHRGGMFVAIAGRDGAGRAVERSWHLVAEGNDGPYIPSMAAEAIIRRVLAGARPAAGARAATRDLELEDYEALFAKRAIATGVREGPSDARAPLFRRVLGEAWHALPEPVRALHDIAGELDAEGIADVERGTGWLSRLAGALFRFPRAAQAVRVKVTFRVRAGREVWRRDFGGRAFTSVLSEARGRAEGLVWERFGPFAFAIALVLEGETLRFVVRRWSFVGIALSRAWAPGGTTNEFAEGGRFRFDVEIRHPLAGLIVRYRGWLEPVRQVLPRAAGDTNSDREDIMAETTALRESSVTVCYNSACPVCRAGMEGYQRKAAASSSAGALALGWRDINTAPDLFRQHGISFDMAMRRLYAFDASGRMLRGIDVIVAIWRELPGCRWLGALAGSPALRPLAWFTYEVLVSYPIYRWSRNRWRRLAARQARTAP